VSRREAVEVSVSYRVLLVEDSGSMRAFVTAALAADGDYEVTEAQSGFEALKVLPRGPYDLIITDINMPDIHGLELVRFIKDAPLHKQTPVVIITSEGSNRDREKGLSLGASDYLVKPFTATDLCVRIRKYLPPAGSATPVV
jgi:two-component system, chemotaxis family, chemotaxis protein CheY